ncbi:putative disease resistance protein RGA4 [Hevea brasiliensis]|uniref:putative disease resistance protein RGA4 n=1 Tax=Hevea brasiliensis TaxID=3981 RepID=UPI0025E739F9|nr:putative disease resistance protein RGA4 [Hevea brasiliensis]
MAEEIAFSIAEQVITKLGSLAFQEIELISGAKDDMKKLENSLSTIKAVCNLFSSSNQIRFRSKLGHRVRDIRQKPNEAENEISSLHLMKKEIVTDVRDKSSGRETSSVLKPDMIGREKDKEKMIESLLNPTSSQGNVSVNAIVGIGGLGKTALAQLVYNDEKVKNYFERKMWQCISEEFDVKLLVKKILECATNNEVPNLLGLEQLHIRLKENLEGKRYLLVLDDVWNEDQKKWDDLIAYLLMGAPGSKILVTIRSTRVALVMGVDSPYVLQGLADNEAWDLFEKLAFGGGHGAVMNPNLIKIGKEMVKKCKGVPLAIRSLGSLMHLKTKESEWSSILESELWRSFQTSENENALSVLKLSYCHMPTYLRQCFSYCAMFPKGHEFDKETLIRLWIAQGYIVCSSKDDDLEDIGDQCFNELLCRSFFHQSKSMDGYKMHDLIHDLAQSIAKDRYFAVENVCEGIHHVYWPSSLNEIEMLVKIKGMRTLFFERFPESVTLKKGLNMIFSNFQKLRSLHLGGYIFENKIFSNFQKLQALQALKLKRLHALNLKGDYIVSNFQELRASHLGGDIIENKIFSNFQKLQALEALELKRLHALHLEGDFGTDIIEVPNSITKLKYLRYLDISGLDMETLPKSITNLQNLQTLILSYCIYLQELPRDIEKLISLRCLMIDGCGKLRCMPIGLGKLTCLRQLSDFVVARDEESNQVNLREKKHLQYLELCWRNTYLYEGPIDNTEVEKDELLLEKLEPHPNLQSLVVESFKGVRFSSWLSSITNLVHITLRGCLKLKQLPPLDQLPYLKTLRLEDLHSLVYISDKEPSFLASPSFTSYPSLQEIELRNCFNLRGWWRKKKRSGVELAQFPCLSKMQIWGCYKLILDDGEAIEWGGLRSLQSLSFRFLSELKSLPKGLQFATNLQELIINHCDSLMALPDWIGNLTSLQRLEISYCPDLTMLPEGMHLLTSLQKLTIHRCLKLSARCMKEKGVDWPKIAHIPNLEIQRPGLSLDYNLFHGPVPASLGNLQNLTGVNLSGNQLNGTLPDSFGQLSQLSALDVSLYNLIGSISEVHFSKLNKLKFLGLSSNSFFSNVSSNWVPPFQVQDLEVVTWPAKKSFDCSSLSSNFLEGPTPLSTFEIELLELSNNRFSGPILEKLAQSMPNLVFLSLSGNQLTGDIPVSIEAMVSLVVLDLSV